MFARTVQSKQAFEFSKINGELKEPNLNNAVTEHIKNDFKSDKNFSELVQAFMLGKKSDTEAANR